MPQCRGDRLSDQSSAGRASGAPRAGARSAPPEWRARRSPTQTTACRRQIPVHRSVDAALSCALQGGRVRSATIRETPLRDQASPDARRASDANEERRPCCPRLDPAAMRPTVLLSLVRSRGCSRPPPCRSPAAPREPSGPPTGSCQLQSAKGADPARHLPPVRQRPLPAGQPERPVRRRADAEPVTSSRTTARSLTNDHTILISHTGGGILSSLTGLYPDRHGQAVSNSYGYFRPRRHESASRRRSSTGPTTPTAATRRTARRRRRPTRTSTWSTPTRPRSAAPARSATRRRRGSRTRAPAATSATSAWRTPCSRTTPRSRSGTRRRRRRSRRPRRPAPRTSRSTASPGSPAGQTLVHRQRRREPRARDDRQRRHGRRRRDGRRPHGTAREGPRRRTRRSTWSATDPTGDMTKVFGAGSPEWNEGRDSQISPSGTAARALAQTDFVGIAIHCADPAATASAPDNSERAARPAPRRGRRLRRLQGLFGAKYVNPAINNGIAVGQRHERAADRRPVRPVRLPGLRRDVRQEHARRGRPDAGGRRPGHVRLHLRRA